MRENLKKITELFNKAGYGFSEEYVEKKIQETFDKAGKDQRMFVSSAIKKITRTDEGKLILIDQLGAFRKNFQFEERHNLLSDWMLRHITFQFLPEYDAAEAILLDEDLFLEELKLRVKDDENLLKFLHEAKVKEYKMKSVFVPGEAAELIEHMVKATLKVTMNHVNFGRPMIMLKEELKIILAIERLQLMEQKIKTEKLKVNSAIEDLKLMEQKIKEAK